MFLKIITVYKSVEQVLAHELLLFIQKTARQSAYKIQMIHEMVHTIRLCTEEAWPATRNESIFLTSNIFHEFFSWFFIWDMGFGYS